MSNFGVLKADIADWLARDTLTAVIPSLVKLAEDDIANDVRLRDQIRRARATGADSRYLALPDNFLEMRRLEIWPDSDRHYSLTQVTPENLQILNMRDTSASSYNFAQRYCIHREIEFDAPVGTTTEIEMVYYERYAALTLDADTNWILQNSYAMYLYGSLLHAEPYLRNDERIPVWAAAYQRAIAKTMDTERKGRVNQGEARVSLSVATP